MTEIYTGIVKWFNTTMGYGFIVRDDGGGDVYVRFNAIIGDEEQRALSAEQRVEFQLTVGGNGPEAQEVRVIK